MIQLELGKARIFVRPGATDMRKQINGLVVDIGAPHRLGVPVGLVAA